MEFLSLISGLFIRKILNDILFNEKNIRKKVNLYSVHDTTIDALLRTLNLTVNDVAHYGSAVIFELHECASKNCLKVVNCAFFTFFLLHVF